jgi:RNA polymerase sigma-70 factor (ECF subfamily)
MVTTNESLLGRLRVENAHEAWKQFFEAYWGAILRYARKLGLNEDQGKEVLQETMVALMRILPDFAYDRTKGRFRNFLLTIVHRKALSVLRRMARQRSVSWDEMLTAEAADPFGNHASAEREARERWRDSLIEEAIHRMRADPKLEEHTFAVFEAYVIEQQPVEQVARRFGLTENAVYQVRNRLLRRLKLEVARLMKSSGSE